MNGSVFSAETFDSRDLSCPVWWRRSLNDDGEGGRDYGPKGELEYWRNRMQRLTSITEQLKRKVQY